MGEIRIVAHRLRVVKMVPLGLQILDQPYAILYTADSGLIIIGVPHDRGGSERPLSGKAA